MIYLLRHGQTETNRDRRIQGQSDRPLTDLGRQQAAALAGAVPPEAPVICSPLRRARETAAALGPDHGPPTIDERWIELDYGDFEGRLIDDVRPTIWENWRTDPTWTPPNGESLAAAAARVTAACADLPMRDDADVIVVSHVNPIKLAVAWALGTPPQIVLSLFVELASITTIGIGAAGQPVLTSFGFLPGSGTGGRAG